MALPEKSNPPTAETAAPEPEITTSGPPELETGGVLTIDIGAVQSNYRALSARVSPTECAAVVKADAYGCGIEPVVRALAKSGCKTFFVAHLAEARTVRALAPEATVYALSGLPNGGAAAFAQANVRPVIGSTQELAEWDAFRATSGWRGGTALHFDTGMNRLGIPVDEAAALAQRIKTPDHGITLIMSHFACSETPANALNNRQIQLFRELRMMFRGIPASLANSSGIFLGALAHFDMVRPGYALYGGNPTPGAANPMLPVLGLKAHIVQVRQVARGETVGYGAAWKAPRPTRVAIVSVGYADGYLRAASGPDARRGAEMMIGNTRCHVVGRVSMDLLAVDVTAVPEHIARRGEWATLIGNGIDIDTLAAQCGTIGYELMCGMGRRYSRIWKQ
ncbi:MAG TPA: alanine racemase [Xanthobacteraceae bacterium]